MFFHVFPLEFSLIIIPEFFQYFSLKILLKIFLEILPKFSPGIRKIFFPGISPFQACSLRFFKRDFFRNSSTDSPQNNFWDALRSFVGFFPNDSGIQRRICSKLFQILLAEFYLKLLLDGFLELPPEFMQIFVHECLKGFLKDFFSAIPPEFLRDFSRDSFICFSQNSF